MCKKESAFRSQENATTLRKPQKAGPNVLEYYAEMLAVTQINQSSELYQPLLVKLSKTNF